MLKLFYIFIKNKTTTILIFNTMFYKKVFIAVLLALVIVRANAQDGCCDFHHPQDKVCGTGTIFKKLMENPEFRAERLEIEKYTQDFIEKGLHNQDKSIKVIPVVFHIIHEYGSENISNAQIHDVMQIINEDFKKLNSDVSDVIPQFTGIAGNPQIEFRLARLDPNGNCTDGITRTVSALTNNADDNVKDLIVWNTSRYLNIWVVERISHGAGGYSYLPSNWLPANYRGIVVINSQLGSMGTSNGSNFAARTLTHEIGHFFNLLHPWGQSNTPGLQTNCSDDDGVSDTPNTIGTMLTCNLSQNTCSSLDNVQNFMDYATCSRMFTQGQVTRMQAALSSTVGGLYYLWQPANLTLTGTNNGYPTTPCAPKADFIANATQACVGGTINFSDKSYNAEVDGSWTWQWTFPGGTPATSTSQNPSITYNTPGTYNVSLTVANATGSNVKTRNQYIRIYPIGGGENMPVFESFENSVFPAHPSDPTKNWVVQGNSNLTWERSTAASHSGNASLRIRNFTIPDGSVNTLTSPNIDMSSIEAPISITFKLAYAQRNAESSDRLRVLVSTNCGYTWIPRYNRTGIGLVTNGGTFVGGNFIPNASQWKEELVNISVVANNKNTLIRFECTSSGGNYLYIDDINITGVVGIDETSNSISDFQIFPNPASYDTYITYSSTVSGNTKFTVYNMLGSVVAQHDRGYLPKGAYDVKLSDILSQPAPGIYMVELNIGGQRTIRRLAVTDRF